MPVNDDTVKDQIRNGGAGMAAYKYTLSEADLNDLVSFIRDEVLLELRRSAAQPALSRE